MRKYGLLVYEYLSLYQADFEVITMPWDAVEVWPTANPIKIVDGTGQLQYQWPGTVFFKIVEHSDWGQAQDDAINDARVTWNNAYPTRLIPVNLQLVFTEEEATGIRQLFETERQRLIDLLPS